MLLLRRILVHVFALIHVAREGEPLKPPDYNSGWMDLWTDTNSTVTNKIVLHGLLETPLLVDVQVKEGDNGNIFQATGHIIQNKYLRTNESKIDSAARCGKLQCSSYEPEGENGVMYIYNHRVVKIIAISKNTHTKYGRCKYTVDFPGGLLRKFRVRAWKSSSLPEPSFKWNKMLGSESLTVIPDVLSDYPELVISRVKFASTDCESFQNSYSDSIGAPIRMLSKSPEKTGYVMYEYDRNSIYIRRSPEILVASYGTGTEETIILDGMLELFVWNSTDLRAFTSKEFYHYDSLRIPTVPGMNLNDTSKFTELLNNTVQAMDVLINKSVSVSSLIDKEMKLSQFLNESLTLGELLNTTHINDIVKSDNNTTLRQIMDMAETIRIVLNGTMTLVQLLDTNLSITHVIDNNLPVRHVMNATLSAGIQYNDQIFFSEFIENETKIVTLVNDVLFVKDSLKYFEVFNESLELDNIFNDDSILSKYRKVFRSFRNVNDSFKVLENAVNETRESASDFNSSLLDRANNINETDQQLNYLEEVCNALDIIKNMVLQMTESVARLDYENITLEVIVTETLKLSELTNNSFEGSSNISGLLEEMAELRANLTILPEFVALNETFMVLNTKTGILETEVQKLLLETHTFTESVDNDIDTWESDFSILEQISSNINLGQLVNSTVCLREVLINSVTLQDSEMMGNRVWTYLDENLQISDIVNDHGNSVNLVDVLEKSDNTRNRALQPNDLFFVVTKNPDDILVRGLVGSYNTEKHDLRTTSSGTLLWYEHMIIPVLCNFGGMVYSISTDVVKIWYPNNYPECSALCLDMKECADGHVSQNCGIEITDNSASSTHFNMWFISKIWNIERSFCGSETCKHGGKCTNLPNTYNCACVDGWTGNNCEININDCVGKCNNSIQCIDRVNDYTCVCKDGWTGKNCNLEAQPFKVLPIQVIQPCTEVQREVTKTYSPATEEGIHPTPNVQGEDSILSFTKSSQAAATDEGTETDKTVQGGVSQTTQPTPEDGTQTACTFQEEDMQTTPSTSEEVTDVPAKDSTDQQHIDGHFVIIGTDAYDITEFSIIKSRHNCTNYVIDIERLDTSKGVSVTVELLGNTCFSPISFCVIYWDDRYSTHLTFNDVSTATVSHTYINDGVYDIKTECIGEDDTITYCPEIHSCMASFLDDTYKSYAKPKRVMTDKTIEINTNDDVSNSCEGAVYNWRFLYKSRSHMIPFNNFIQPQFRHIVLPRSTLTPGIYVVILEVMLGQLGSNDFIVLHVIPPELHYSISGGDFLYVPHGNIIHVNVSTSHDNDIEFNLNNHSKIVSLWTFGLISGEKSDYEVYDIMNNNLQSVSSMFEIQSGNVNILEIDTSYFPLDSYGVAVFKITSGKQSSTVVQVLKFVDNVLPATISCVYNCNASHGGLINYDKLTLDTQIEMSVTEGYLMYEWNVYTWINDTFKRFTDKIDITDKPSLTIPKTFVEEGETYIFEVKISTNDHRLRNTVSVKRTFDYVPHGGTCEIYKDNGDRDILIMLKVGNPEKNYETSIKVRIADVYKNFNEICIYDISSKPVLSVHDIDRTESGAEIVRDYIRNRYSVSLELLLYSIDRPAVTVYYISTVCSNLYLIQFSEKEPVVPKVLNENGKGVVLDLTKDGNSTVTYLQDTLKESLNITLSPTTIILREFLKNMADIVTSIYINLTQRPDSVTDKAVFSVITNAFSNLASKAQFLDKATKAHLVDLIKRTGSSNIYRDIEVDLEEAADQTFKMSMAVSSASVSSSLDQYRSTDDIYSAMHQIDDMLSIVGDDLDIYSAAISPQERAMLYYKMQRQLYLFIDEVKENAKIAANSTIVLARDIQDKLKQCQQCDNKATGSAKQLLKTTDACKLMEEMSRTLTSAFNLDGIASFDNTSCYDTKISVSAFEFEENIYMYDNDGTSSLITSNVLRLDVKTSDKRVSAEHITFEQEIITPKPMHIVPFVDEEDVSQFMYHRFLYQKSTESVCIVVQPLGEPDLQSYLIYIKFSKPPSIIDYDIKFKVYKDSNWQTCLDPHQMKGHSGVTYLAISFQGRFSNVSKAETDNSEISKKDPGKGEMLDYNIIIVTMGCLSWEEEKTRWNYDKCRLTHWRRNEGKIVCLCRGVTDMVFGNSFFTAPNAIDFSTVFLKFSPLSQAAVLGTIGGMFIIYIISVIILARLDKKDKLKWAITPLRDNFIIDEYFYVITVLTGMRRGAGTRSRIAFNLSGENDISGHRELFDGVREEFGTGSVLSFIMSTYDDLGDLQSLRIWHDNRGEGSFASWYLNQVDVFDVQRNKTYTFPFETWLSLETGLEATLTSIPTNKSLDLESRFFGNLRHRLSEGHMLISIIYRPVMSVFTRVQRVSCAFVFIMLNMLANALYFNPEPNYQTPALIQIGPFRFSSQQIYISIFCALFTTIPVCFLIELFKRTKRSKPKTKKICCCLPPCHRCKRGSKYRYKHEEMLNSMPILMDEAQIKNTLRFPPRFIYLAWLIVAGGTVIPAFIILLFSMEWGKQKSEEWLTTLTMSLLESILLIDPFVFSLLNGSNQVNISNILLNDYSKRGRSDTDADIATQIKQNQVICISFLLAVIFRSKTLKKDSSVTETVSKYRKGRGEDKNTVSSSLTVLKSIVTEFNSYKSHPREVSEPIQGDNLKQVQEKQRQYRSFQNSLKDINLNLVFILIVSVICYSNRDVRSYLHHWQLSNQLVRPHDTQHFHSINTPNDLYQWINKTMIPYLFREHDEYGMVLHWTERQMTQNHAFRLGPPRLRQVRIKRDTHDIPYIGRMSSYGEYEIWSEEDASYCIGWKKQPCSVAETVYNMSSAAWAFTSSLETWGLPLTGYYTTYGGGGYIAALNVNLNYSIATINELYKNLWIDRQTRALIVEFTIYDASTNLFIYNMFMIEFPQTGGAFTSYNIYPLRVYQYHGAAGTWTLVCEVLFVFYLICLLIKICVRIYRQRLDYFRKFWTVYELVLVSVAATATGFYCLRLGFTFDTIKRFNQDKRIFVNFSHVMVWDQLFVLALGVLAFLATIRMLEVLSTLKHLKSIVDIFKKCGKDLFWYGITFVQLFIGFCGLAFLLFGSKLESYRNLYQCMGTLFIAMIGKSRFTEINETQPVLAKIFFLLYVLVVVYFFLTIFLSILGASIDEVVQKNRSCPEHDIFSFVLRKIKELIHQPAIIMKKKRRVNTSPF